MAKPSDDLVEVAESELSDVITSEPEIIEVVADPAGTCRVKNGDSYLSIAVECAPKGAKVGDYAQAIADMNGHTPLREGTVLLLPKVDK